MGKKYVKTDEVAAQVSALRSFGHKQEDIARYLNISEDTLDRHYRYELDTAIIHANAAVANRLYAKAVEQDDLAAQIFWLKTRGRWRTRDNLDESENDARIAEELKNLRKELDAKNKKEY